ncbi:MAG TPA: hypothetical protein VF511_02525, partial [Chthoniobacterales bacterium]
LDDFNAVVREARQRSIKERRPLLIVWDKGQVGLRFEGAARGEEAEPVVKWKLAKDETLKISFPAALLEDPPPEWIFWPSGNCEPAVVSYRGRNGSWTATYSALTARSETVAYVAK